MGLGQTGNSHFLIPADSDTLTDCCIAEPSYASITIDIYTYVFEDYLHDVVSAWDRILGVLKHRSWRPALEVVHRSQRMVRWYTVLEPDHW